LVINRLKINRFLLSVIFFLVFLGFYAILLVLFNAGMAGFTRQVTIPIRVIIGLSLISLVFLNYKQIKVISETRWFLFFAFLYVLRVVIDFYLKEKYYVSTSEILFYFISFAVIPFVSLSTFRFNEKYLSTILNTIFFSGLIFSVLAILLYRSFIGQTSRLTSSAVGEDVISPLALSYCATFIIGVLTAYFLYNKKTGKRKKMIGFGIIGLAVVPFFLGASRGSLVALFLPFIMIFFSGKGIRFFIKSGFAAVVILLGIVYLSEYFGSGLLNRFLNISEDIESGSSSAIRFQIWESSFSQFLYHPIFGDKLRVEFWNGYPHNLFLEVLQTMGLLGFIPFFILTFNAVKACFRIFRYHPKYAWVAIIFLQSFIHNMFSGAIYTAAWFWASMAFLLAARIFMEKKRLHENY
jgi:O-antigen ligase